MKDDVTFPVGIAQTNPALKTPRRKKTPPWSRHRDGQDQEARLGRFRGLRGRDYRLLHGCWRKRSRRCSGADATRGAGLDAARPACATAMGGPRISQSQRGTSPSPDRACADWPTVQDQLLRCSSAGREPLSDLLQLYLRRAGAGRLRPGAAPGSRTAPSAAASVARLKARIASRRRAMTKRVADQPRRDLPGLMAASSRPGLEKNSGPSSSSSRACADDGEVILAVESGRREID